MKATDKIYKLSNAIETIATNTLRSTEYNALLQDGNASKRQRNAQALVNYLCDKFKIAPTSVLVCNRPQPHSTNDNGAIRSKTLGNYTLQTAVIRIYNLTAAKRQEVSIKVFADTLLHEFMHHYDMQYLKLGATIHTAGFYKRISDLKNKLSK